MSTLMTEGGPDLSYEAKRLGLILALMNASGAAGRASVDDRFDLAAALARETEAFRKLCDFLRVSR